MRNDITIDQLKACRGILEASITALIESHANITGDRPIIKIDRILAVTEEGRTFTYEVKIK